MKTFVEKKFNIPELKGISAKATEAHLKLYSGYVKHANLILEKIPEYEDNALQDTFAPYVVGELRRRFSFEFCGLRNHEIYFNHFEGGSTPLTTSGPFYRAITEEWNTFDAWLKSFKALALTRGVGWAMLYYDKTTKRLLNNWNDEQHLGHLVGLTPILALDMWEHAFLFDFGGDKPKYVEAFFDNLNWQSAEKNFASAQA